jgi:uncharacterized membrane protein YbaN (DUF454 family)
MKEKMKRGVVLFSSGVLILIGIIGIILPIMPGIPFLLLGLSFLGIDATHYFKKYIS